MPLNRVLYIGQYSQGTTSKLRGEALKEILKATTFNVIDTHVTLYACHRLWRSLAFRFKIGKVISNTNRYIVNQLSGYYDVIWVDKAVYITPKVTRQLRAMCRRLIHYTPDTAFTENQSKKFYKSLHLYDYAITTKSFEMDAYLNYIKPHQLLYTTQGYDKNLHYPRHSFQQKQPHVLFIGLYEPSRAKVLQHLLQADIPIVLAGKKWTNFVKQHQNYNLTYLGEGLFGEAYVEAISKAQMALGLVWKRFPELHTTRTFEIPACGTALITEYNQEIAQFYKDDEVIFFTDIADLVTKIKYYLANPNTLEQIIKNGLKKVQTGGYDYQEQLTRICEQTGVFNEDKTTS